MTGLGDATMTSRPQRRRPSTPAAVRAAVVVAVVAAAGCTSTGPGDGADPEPQPAPFVVTARPDPDTLEALNDLVVAVDTVRLISPDALEIRAVGDGCGNVASYLAEHDDRVEVALWSGRVERDCGDVGISVTVALSLAAPLGDRDVVVEVTPHVFDQADDLGGPCLVLTPGGWCRTLTLRSAGRERLTGAPAYDPRPVDLVLKAGPNPLATSGTLSLTLTLPEPIAEPAVVEFRTLWRPDLDLWGSVVIHNIERQLDGPAELDRQVDGHPAFRVTPAGGAAEAADSVTIDTGVWAIDISLWTGDPTRREDVLGQLLDGLTITERPGQLPRVDDPGGIVGETSELLIVGGATAGVGFSFAPNCDADPAPGCVAGAGYLYPLEGVVDRVAGVAQLRSPPVEGGPPVALPAGTDIRVTDFGSHTLPMSCDGGPAFDPALLPSGVSAFEAHQSVEVYTGLRFWPTRLLPGFEIHRAGGPDAPSAVATYERTADGTWRTVSVTACR